MTNFIRSEIRMFYKFLIIKFNVGTELNENAEKGEIHKKL